MPTVINTETATLKACYPCALLRSYVCCSRWRATHYSPFFFSIKHRHKRHFSSSTINMMPQRKFPPVIEFQNHLEYTKGGTRLLLDWEDKRLHYLQDWCLSGIWLLLGVLGTRGQERLSSSGSHRLACFSHHEKNREIFCAGHTFISFSISLLQNKERGMPSKRRRFEPRETSQNSPPSKLFAVSSLSFNIL